MKQFEKKLNIPLSKSEAARTLTKRSLEDLLKKERYFSNKSVCSLRIITDKMTTFPFRIYENKYRTLSQMGNNKDFKEGTYGEYSIVADVIKDGKLVATEKTKKNYRLNKHKPSSGMEVFSGSMEIQKDEQGQIRAKNIFVEGSDENLALIRKTCMASKAFSPSIKTKTRSIPSSTAQRVAKKSSDSCQMLKMTTNMISKDLVCGFSIK